MDACSCAQHLMRHISSESDRTRSRVDHSKAFLCTTCGWGFFVLGLFTFKG